MLSHLYVRSWTSTSICLILSKSRKKRRKTTSSPGERNQATPGTDVGDYNVKLRAIIKFLEEGNKVKITLRFRGREMAHQQLGLAQLQKLKLTWLNSVLLNRCRKWKAVKWVCCLIIKEKVSSH